MSILYISGSRVPSRAANSIHVMKMCSAFSENGHSVYLMTEKVKTDIEKDVGDIFDFYGVKNNFSLYRLPWLEIPSFAFVYAVQILFIFLFLTFRNNCRPHCYSRFTLGLFMVSFFGPKLTYEMHATLPNLKSEIFMFKRLIKRKNFSSLVVISKNLADDMLNEYPELKNKIIIAPDGADNADRSDKILLPNHGNSEAIHLGYVGHLYQGRGIQLLIDIVKDDDNLHLHLIGGTAEDITYWEERTIEYENVTLHGFVTPKQTIGFRNSMDILLAPYEEKVSIYGGAFDTSRWMSPLKIFEYMSAKKPIVCSDLPVLREILKDRENSLLCPPNDLGTWKDAITELIEDKELADTLSNKSYNDFIRNYTWRKRAERVLGNVYYRAAY